VLLTLLAGWGVVLLIRLAGGGTLAALAGMAACYTLPTWFWLNQSSPRRRPWCARSR